MLHPELEKLHPGFTLADLPSHDFQVAPRELGQTIAAAFERRPDLPAVIVAGPDGEFGLISRGAFFHQLSRPFSLEIYLKRPISLLLEVLPGPPLRLPSDCPVAEAARLALNRAPHLVYEPILIAATRSLGDNVEIRIRDNGTGMLPDVKEKMFNPFFTTKPAGEGTGLGLSISHDIIVKQHNGSIDVNTEPGAFTEFRIVLPR